METRTKGSFCAGYFNGDNGMCNGDAGGPLVCNGELQGIVSSGYGCAESNFPDLFTRVCEYVEWIEKIIRWN